MEVTLKLKIKGVEYELTLEEAKRLRDSLDLAFPKDKEYIPYPYPVYPAVPVYPVWDPGNSWEPYEPQLPYYYNNTGVMGQRAIDYNTASLS